jgi:hypothetical protein
MPGELFRWSKDQVRAQLSLVLLGGQGSKRHDDPSVLA